MKNILRNTLVTFLMLYALDVSAFSPETISRSLVKITIIEDGVAKLTSSGFVFKNNTSIITSLHVMRPGQNVRIRIDYGTTSCLARVVKVHKDADLVLLEAYNQNGSPLNPSWIPLSTISENPLKFAEDIFSVGYNSGSNKWISRKLSKGSGGSEKLSDLIPSKDVTQIKNLGMPNINLNVIYIDGSLLPGFSGAPLLNNLGQLIGIADGGLENGASNVSWGIPSREIANLLTSNISVLPTSIGKASVVFSAEMDAPMDTKIIKFNNYEFVHTKTRTLQELIDRSDDRETLLTWLEAFQQIKVSYSSISFDIYEDIVNGFIITVPHGKNLAIEHEMLSVQLNDASEEKYYLYYSPGNILGEYEGELTQEVMEECHKDIKKYFVDSYKEYPSYMVVEDDEEYKVKKLSNGYLVTAGFFVQPTTSTEDHPEYTTYLYCKFIVTNESSVLCFAYINDYSTANLVHVGKCMQLNSDCNQSGTECDYACILAHDWMQILACANLTTVADNK